MASVRTTISHASDPAIAWDVARLLPEQGQFTEADYLRLTAGTNKLAEFTDGSIEVLPMPTIAHQRTVAYLYRLLILQTAALGETLFAPMRVRLREGKFREPDLAFMLNEHAVRKNNEFWDGADLVIEVVSEDNPNRDLRIKRQDYAEAGIPEYWIVDPRTKTVTVLKFENGMYLTHAEVTGMGKVESAILSGFVAEVEEIFAAAK
jgi:Uma2 family endonuclease